MFALKSRSGGFALMRDGKPFTYTSRRTAHIAARILGKRDSKFYKVVDA